MVRRLVAPIGNVPTTKSPAALARVRARPESNCGVQEVAPDTFVQIDCLRYTRLRLAQVLPPHVFQRKLGMFRAGALRLDPPNFASGGVGGGQGAGNQGGSPFPFPLPFNPFNPAPAPSQPTPSGPGPGPTPTNPFTVDDWLQLWPKTPDGKQVQVPGDVDHRRNGTTGPVKDQEAVGACTAFSFSTAMDNAIRRLNRSEAMSPMHVWSHYGRPSMQAAGDANLNAGIARVEDWTYDPALACRMYKGSSEFGCGEEYNVREGSADADPAVRAKLADTDKKGRYKVTNITEIPMDPDTIAQTLATGQAVWGAFCIEHWSSKYVVDGVVSDWGPNCSGHAIVLAGYRQSSDGRQFLVHNSWGPKWGVGGFAYVSERMIRQRLEFAYTLKVEPGAGVASAHPEDMTDDDCGWDELVDATHGRCAKMCIDGSRPKNGTCGVPFLGR